jgi:tetratricopeptide (TPR) repeat protein
MQSAAGDLGGRRHSAESKLQWSALIAAPFQLLDDRYTFSRYQLACCQILDNRPALAEALLEELRPLYDRPSKPGMPDEANFAFSYGSAYVSDYQPAKAVPWLLRSLHALEKEKRVETTLGVDVLHALGKIYRDQQLVDEAIPYFDRTLAASVKLYGPHSEEVFTTLHDKAYCLYMGKRYVDAAKVFAEAEATADQMPANGHRRKFYARNGLAATLFAQGKTSEAQQLLQESLKTMEPDQKPSSVSYTVGRLGYILQRQNKLDEAARYYQQAVAINSTAGQLQSPEFVEAAKNYIALLKAQHKDADAERVAILLHGAGAGGQ